MSKKITVYSMLNCPYCTQAKNLLKQRGLAYEEKMVDEWPDADWDLLVKKTGLKTLPQIFVDETVIGGFSQLAELDQKDKLESLK